MPSSAEMGTTGLSGGPGGDVALVGGTKPLMRRRLIGVVDPQGHRAAHSGIRGRSHGKSVILGAVQNRLDGTQPCPDRLPSAGSRRRPDHGDSHQVAAGRDRVVVGTRPHSYR